MNTQLQIPAHLHNLLQALVILLALVFFLMPDEQEDPGIELKVGAPAFYEHWRWQSSIDDFDIDNELARLQLEDGGHDLKIRQLLHEQQYQQARSQLLEIAAASVLQNNQSRLADTMLLLGEVAIHQQELASAEIYLQEALHLTIQQGDVIGTGRCYQLLGQLNIRARELARQAAYSNDSLWQARNAISRGLYHGVEETLRTVIEQNTAIRRYGAAAHAHEAMASLHDRLYNEYQAQDARIAAARLYASTGQVTHVRRLLEGLDPGWLTQDQRQQLEQEIDEILDTHQRDLAHSSQAQNYQMLYHHYLREGNLEQAWQFRIKASKTLASSSDRAVFQRQADVIAVLYNSNFAMDRARAFLDKASVIYDEQNTPELREQIRDLEALIY